ncbi:peptidase S8/S53 domain-containing protein [Ilyonectria destructans]|nr:peptidase S8/S53 domain-containing protein [Ilyonectria destructans]
MVRLSLAACLFAGLSSAVQLDNTETKQASSRLPGAYIVEFEDDSNLAGFNRKVAGQATTRMEFNYKLFKGVSIQFNDLDKADDMATNIAALPAVKNMWPVKVYSIPKPTVEWVGTPGVEHAITKKRAINETEADTFSPHVMTQVDKLRAKGITGKGIKVAVIDTGIDYDHPALGGCFGPDCLVSFGTDFVGDDYDGYNAVYPDEDPMDCAGHGSHVAGIIAAQENSMGFTGAAPGVTLGAYRVFGCDGEAGNDVLIAAFNQAFEDGADIITASIGGPSGWSEEPWSVAVSRIVEQGVPCTVSAGNSGDVGMFYASTAANGKKVMAIASYDNSKYMALLNTSHYTVDGSSTKVAFGSTAGSPSAWGGVKLPLWAPSYDTTITNGGCDAYPADTPDLSGHIVLVRRGTCTFVQKAQNAAAAGAKYIMVYNNAGGAVAIDVSTVPGILAAGMVTSDVGAKMISLLKAGSTVTLEMSDGTDGNVILSESTNSVTGGSISTFSSWGPTWELDVKPQFGAPGGSILSTYPRAKGSYAVLSGTSMACPGVAGIIALIAEVRGTLEPALIENLLSANADPTLFNDGAKFYDFLAPVPQQGGGLIKAYDAAYANVILSHSSLSFNDTDNFVSVLNFTIENTGSEDIDFDISNIPTKAVYTLDADSIYPAKFPNEFTDGPASLKFSETKLSVGAGDSVTIEVVPTPPEGLTAKRLPLWSGFIAINGSDGTSLSLPYQGLAGSLHDSTVLAPEDTWISLSTDKSLTPVAANSSFTLPAQGTNDSSAVLPALTWFLALGSAQLQAEVIPVSAVSNATSKSLGAPVTFPMLWNAMGSNSLKWTGELLDGSFAPAGRYKIAYRALRIFGDETKESDWDKSVSPVFSIKYAK